MNSKQVDATITRLIFFMGDVKGGNLHSILAFFQNGFEKRE
jgi:hypothetical protein